MYTTRPRALLTDKTRLVAKTLLITATCLAQASALSAGTHKRQAIDEAQALQPAIARLSESLWTISETARWPTQKSETAMLATTASCHRRCGEEVGWGASTPAATAARTREGG